MTLNNIGKMCCGCRACETICPVNAITMKKNEYGFVYPNVNNDKCINCNLCNTTCPIQVEPNWNEYKSSYIAHALNDNDREMGSSGGVFGILAKSIIEKEGIVFAAGFDENLKLATKSAQNEDELIPLYKSKYLLCDTQSSFHEIENHLKNNKIVLYCSTPCQIYALKLFLKDPYDNLITVDFVCHGVGSQDLFDKSILYMERKNGYKIENFIFRQKKENAVSSHYYRILYKTKTKKHEDINLYMYSPYYLSFCKQLCLRDSCYSCKFATNKRVSDITIADFHTIEKYYKDIDRFKGVSMIISNTEEGNNLISNCRNKLFIKDTDIKTLINNNECLQNPTKKPRQRESFLNSLVNDEFDVTVRKHLNWTQEWKKLIYYKSPSPVRKLIKKIILGD